MPNLDWAELKKSADSQMKNQTVAIQEDSAKESFFYPDNTPSALSQSDGNAFVLSTIQTVLSVACTAALFTGHAEVSGALYGISGLISAFAPVSDASVKALEVDYEIKAKVEHLADDVKLKIEEVKIKEHAAKMKTVHGWLADHAQTLRSHKPEDVKVIAKDVLSLEQLVDANRGDSLQNRINDLLGLISWKSGSIARVVLLDAISLLFTTHENLARYYAAQAAHYMRDGNVKEAKAQQGLFFDNLNTMESESRRIIADVKAKFEEMAVWRLAQFSISRREVPNKGGRALGFLATFLGGQNDVRVDTTDWTFTLTDSFSSHSRDRTLVVSDDSSNEQRNQDLDKYEKEIRAGYATELHDHLQRAFVNTAPILAAWEAQITAVAKILCPQPPSGAPAVLAEYRVARRAEALEGAASVAYAYKLVARRVNQGKPGDIASSMSSWTAAMALHDDGKLPVLVTTDRDFYLKTVREIYRKAQFPTGSARKNDPAEGVLVSRIEGSGEIQWVDEIKAVPHGKD